MSIDPLRLPHWARVAFAARCARRVQPLFLRAWPQAIPARKAAVEQAITLAEKSASEKRAMAGLDKAVLNAMMAAGRAQIPRIAALPVKEEPAPLDYDAAVVASLSAKVAEKAAEAAMSGPDQSGRPAHEAFHFALDAIRAAGRPGLVEVLEADFAAVEKAAAKRPWWRFW